MEQRAEAFSFLPFPLAYAPEGYDVKHEPPPNSQPVPAAAEQPFGMLRPDVIQHPTDEDLLYAAMLYEQPLEEKLIEESLLEDGSMLHLADALSFSDAERSSYTRQVCAAAGCTLMCRPRGRLCVKHQKQRERGRTPFELKDPGVVLRKGRPPVPFSKSSNRRKKLQRLDELMDEFAGGSKEEGTMLLQAYLESGFWSRRTAAVNHAPDHTRLFAFIGRAVLAELPPTHPLRVQLGELFTDNQIKEAMLASSEAAARNAVLFPSSDEQEAPEQLL